MKILCAVAFLAMGLGTTSAYACVDGRNMRYYFTREWPEGVRNAVQVRIVAMDGDRVTAKLTKAFARALGVKSVVVELSSYPQGGNCIDYGETKGRVFVPVSGVNRDGNTVRLYAFPMRTGPTPPRRPLSEIDRYIVDPAMKKAAEESRPPQ